MTLTDRERALFGYIRFIVAKSLPISYVADHEVSAFSKHGEVFSKETFKKVLFNLVALVEERISTEMLCVKGALMHDGWTNNGMHYVDLFAIYCREVKMFAKGTLITKEEVACPLLAMKPMGKVTCEDENPNEEPSLEAKSFSAEVYIRFCEEIFADVYKVYLHERVLCHIADNCSVNKLIETLLKTPHIGCANHKIHL